MAENKQERLTLKVALGVFFGVLAALVLYHVPGWYRSHETYRAQEAQADVDIRLLEMTPMDFVARCGSLVEDKTVGHDVASAFRVVTVEMTMPDGMKKRVTAEWSLMSEPMDNPSNWLLSSVDNLDPASDTWKSVIESNYPCTVESPGNDSDELSFLTPSEVISRCGNPISNTSVDNGRTVTRYLTFAKNVTAVFGGIGGEHRDLTLDYFGGLTVNGDSDAVIEKWYPCLKPLEP